MFWLDKIEYTPGPNVKLAGEVLKFDSSDANVRYDNNSGSWIPDSGTSSAGPLFNQTATTGASLSFTFNGTSASLYGFLEGDTPRAPSSGRYYIDGVNDTTFVNPGSRPLPSNISGDYYNEFLFKSQDLEPGTHDMTVMFTGVRAAEGETPIQWLAIDYFYVTASEGSKAGANKDTGSGGNGSGGTGNGSGSDSGPGSSSGKTPVGAIVGGVIGAVVALALLGLATLLLLKRRQKKRDANTVSYGYLEPAVYTSEPPSSRFHPHPYTATSLYDPKSPEDTIPLLTPNRSVKDRVDVASSSSSAAAPTSTHGSSLQNMEDARRAGLAQNSFERRHQDSGIRFPSAQRVVDVPPDYTIE
ncbi:hypothetical protein Moror_3456 [Moniliophthora roreri MCA 2997]|nr:hypothetical protein Moror_3456 [Moniliophthora roreri MCA 2997]